MGTREDICNFHSCDMCSYGSKSLLTMINHIKQHRTRPKLDQFNCTTSSLELYECEYCGYKTSLQVVLNDHVDSLHKDLQVRHDLDNILRSYKCKNCNFITYSLLVLARHVSGCSRKKTSNTQVGKALKGSFCSCQIKVKQPMLATRQNPDNIKWLECDQCPHKAKQKRPLHKHLKPEDLPWKGWTSFTSSEGTKMFKCNLCSYQIKHSSNLKRHMLAKHTNPEDMRWFECDQCSYKAKRKTHLEKYVISKHTKSEDVQWLECEFCKLRTKHKVTLKSHILTKHSNVEDVRWFRCAQCSFKTKYKSNLKDHILGRHRPPEEVQWHQCPYCPFRTKPKSYLKKHVLEKHAVV